MQRVFGEIKSLRAREKAALEKLASRRTDPFEPVDNDIARRASRLAHDLHRLLALIIGRDGEIEVVACGGPNRVYLPDLGRFRLDSSRLRQLRLIVFHPQGDRIIRSLPAAEITYRGSPVRSLELQSPGSTKQVSAPTISSDLITDLEKLRLDLVMVIAVDQKGNPGAASVAHMRPLADAIPETFSDELKVSPVGVAFERFTHLSAVDLHMPSLIADLEEQFAAIRVTPRAIVKDGAILVGAYTGSAADARSSMDELQELARTAGLEVLDTVIQRRQSLDPRTLIGKGKVEEVVLHCLDVGADMLVFDRELAPGQLRSITNLTELRVIDRSMLILDIFAQRATSSEGRLQVELAQLQYSLPRLTEKDSGLSRLTGGIGGRGPGETKLEISRRRARDRIAELERQIVTVGRQRALRRERRQLRGVPVVAIVGYTNAGKSTLLNALTQSDVFVENKLFATLDPTSRRMRFPNEREVIFVDTVGFIRELPKELVNAFRATLEEISEADVLLHVIDASDRDALKQAHVVRETLDDLEFGDIPRVVAVNKIDRASSEAVSGLTTALGGIAVSALQRTGFKELVSRLQERLAASFEGADPGNFLNRSSARDFVS